MIELPDTALAARAGRYAAGGDTLELTAAPPYLYASANRLGVPTTVMFLPQSDKEFTGYDPLSEATTRLRFRADRSALEVELPDGRRVTAER